MVVPPLERSGQYGLPGHAFLTSSSAFRLLTTDTGISVELMTSSGWESRPLITAFIIFTYNAGAFQNDLSLGITVSVPPNVETISVHQIKRLQTRMIVLN
jgi:hypothetical protein